MALIETEEAAGRLARVIASDIVLYNQRKIEEGMDITAEVQEGFMLFRARVVPSLLPVFETVLADKGLITGKTPPPIETPRDVSAEIGQSASPAMTDASASDETPVPAATPEPTPIPVVSAAVQAAPSASASVPDPNPGARRLARVIISDIQIYNPQKVASGADLSAEIEEGRALFKTRVGAEFLHIFEAQLVEKGWVKAAPVAPARVAMPPRAEMAPRRAEMQPPREEMVTPPVEILPPPAEIEIRVEQPAAPVQRRAAPPPIPAEARAKPTPAPVTDANEPTIVSPFKMEDFAAWRSPQARKPVVDTPAPEPSITYRPTQTPTPEPEDLPPPMVRTRESNVFTATTPMPVPAPRAASVTPEPMQEPESELPLMAPMSGGRLAVVVAAVLSAAGLIYYFLL
jgi:hypothetical protein